MFKLFHVSERGFSKESREVLLQMRYRGVCGILLWICQQPIRVVSYCGIFAFGEFSVIDSCPLPFFFSGELLGFDFLGRGRADKLLVMQPHDICVILRDGISLWYIAGMVREGPGSFASALELRLSCTSPSIWCYWTCKHSLPCIWNSIVKSRWYFAHVTTAMQLWRVQNFVVIQSSTNT